MNDTDWVFVLDSDEYLVPVNFNASEASPDWCGNQHPSLISQILSQMLITATRMKLDSFENLMRNESLNTYNECLFGYSFNYFKPHCKPIAAFSIPVYAWLQTTVAYATPLIRSKFPSAYVSQLNNHFHNGQTQTWKSVYQTRYNPPLVGKSLHHNPGGGHSVLAPRSFHGGLSLEIAHARIIRHKRNEKEEAPFLVEDKRWAELHADYEKCASRSNKQ